MTAPEEGRLPAPGAVTVSSMNTLAASLAPVGMVARARSAAARMSARCHALERFPRRRTHLPVEVTGG